MKENPSANVINIDDDVLYSPKLINILIQKHRKYPNAILCPITSEIKIEHGKQKINCGKMYRRIVIQVLNTGHCSPFIFFLPAW